MLRVAVMALWLTLGAGCATTTPPAADTPAAEETCASVGGECMEGCEEGWTQRDPRPAKRCTDSVCCVKKP